MSKKNYNTIIIAEIGINHNGSLVLAKKMMMMAKNCGCDYVKFQKRNPDITTPENKKKILRETPWGKMSYLKYKKKIEFGLKEYKSIDKFSKKINMPWFASAWDIGSLKFLSQFNHEYNKVASAMITNLNFLEAVAKQKKTTFISTGMSNYKNIKDAVKIFKKNKCPFVLMHSVSSYPCNEKDLNLSIIPKLKKKFKCKVGYSGHESTVSPTIGACYLGATYIERHITLDRAMWGTDQAASLSPAGLKSLVIMIKKIQIILGDGKKKILKDELHKSRELRYW
jgi:N-acetylneuraminate synthase